MISADMVRVCIFSLSPVRVGGCLQDVALRSSSPSAESPRNVIYSHGARSAGPRAAGHRVRTGARVSCPFLRGCLFFWMGLCLRRGGHPPSLPRLSLPFPGRTSGSPQLKLLIRVEGDTESDTESAAGHADGPSDGPSTCPGHSLEAFQGHTTQSSAPSPMFPCVSVDTLRT